jgi:hypothetical protein
MQEAGSYRLWHRQGVLVCHIVVSDSYHTKTLARWGRALVSKFPEVHSTSHLIASDLILPVIDYLNTTVQPLCSDNRWLTSARWRFAGDSLHQICNVEWNLYNDYDFHLSAY